MSFREVSKKERPLKYFEKFSVFMYFVGLFAPKAFRAAISMFLMFQVLQCPKNSLNGPKRPTITTEKSAT